MLCRSSLFDYTTISVSILLLIIIYSQLLTLTNKSAVNNLVHIFVLSIFFDGQITPLGDKTVSDIGDL